MYAIVFPLLLLFLLPIVIIIVLVLVLSLENLLSVECCTFKPLNLYMLIP
jgi:hypothetical protein